MKKITAIGIVVALLGIASVIVSQAVPFTKTAREAGGEFTMGMSYQVEDTKTKNIVLTSGIVLLIAGGITAVASNARKPSK